METGTGIQLLIKSGNEEEGERKGKRVRGRHTGQTRKKARTRHESSRSGKERERETSDERN